MTKPRSAGKDLTSAQANALLAILKARFEKNKNRHPGVEWANILARLKANPAALRSLHEMEQTGGQPDLVGHDRATGECVFFDCSPESPAGRANACYDRAALDARKKNKPKTSALDLAAAMGVELLTEVQYLQLQQLGVFDAKSSSWIQTPPEVRKLGGALFCQRRFGRVFVSANGADSYFGGRGFRACLKV